MNIVDFFFEAGELKRIARSGWWSAKVRHPETVAEHSWRAALIAYVLAIEEKENPEKCAFFALIHDLPEARTLDLHRVSQHYVKISEEKAKKDQLAQLPKRLRENFDQKPSENEARIVKDADLLELALTAEEYLAAGYVEAKTWRDRAGEVLKTKTARKWFAQIKKTRPARWYSKFRKQRTKARKA